MTEFDTFTIHPEKVTMPDTVGVYALPINADPSNTGDRLVSLANKVGFPLVAIDYLNQGRNESYGVDVAHANVPSGITFRLMSEYRERFTAKLLRPFGESRVIGIGDSLGVPTLQGAALRQEALLFDAVLLRDGWNLGKPTSAIRGIGRYGLYQARNITRNLLHPSASDVVPGQFLAANQEWSHETSFVKKLWNVSGIMKGDEARKNAILLAGQAALPMHVVLFGNGLSNNGEPEPNEQFKWDLLSVRERAANRLGDGAVLAVTVENHAWHSDLMDPDLASKHIKTTLGLLEK